MLGAGVVRGEVREEWRLVMMAYIGEDRNEEPQGQSWSRAGRNEGQRCSITEHVRVGDW